MNALVLSLFVGVLTVKERCHNFDCRVVKTFKEKCVLSFDGSTASLLGITMPVKQYMWGPLQGFDGNDGVDTEVTVFLKNRRMYKAYVSQYVSKNVYDRWMCKFRGY